MNRLPASLRASFNILEAIIEVSDRAAAAVGFALHDFIQPAVRLHGAVFVGKNVTVEMDEERESPLNMPHGQGICVGENIRWHAFRSQRGLKFNDLGNRRKNIGKEFPELVGRPAKSSEPADLLKKLFSRD